MDEVCSLSSSLQIVIGQPEPVVGTSHADSGGLTALSNDQNGSQTLSNILCPAPSDHDNSLNCIFFGVTSSFARFANSIGRSGVLADEAAVVFPHVPRPFELLHSSVILDVAQDVSETEARKLARVYYQSIEISYPILGQDLLNQTLDHVYGREDTACNSDDDDDDDAVKTRFYLVLSISLALLKSQDQRLQVVADAYFRKAVARGSSRDQFVHPTQQSLQMVLLLCIYAWICPTAMDVWRLLGHASRMCLDMIEVHGSGKVDSNNTVVLYRTLYALETQLAIAFGRPSQLPDGQDIPAYGPDFSSMPTHDFSTMVYNLARLQGRFHKQLIGNDQASSPQTFSVSAMTNAPWMGDCVQDMKTWLDDWNAQVDAINVETAASRGGGVELREPLRLYGGFKQCEALLLAKLATERCGQALVSDDEAAAACKRLLRAASKLHQRSTLTSGPANFMFDLSWTRAHAVFTALSILLPNVHSTPTPDMETQGLVRTGMDMLAATGDHGGTGLVRCLQRCWPESITN